MKKYSLVSCFLFFFVQIGLVSANVEQPFNVELFRKGELVGDGIMLKPFGETVIKADSFVPESVKGFDWQPRNGCHVIELQELWIKLRTFPGNAETLENNLRIPRSHRVETVKCVVWNGVSAYIINLQPNEDAKVLPRYERIRYLLAPVADKFLLLTFSGSSAAFNQKRKLMQKIATKIRFDIQGLVGKYYEDVELHSLRMKRVDPGINFNWNSAPPTKGMSNCDISVRWTGLLRPPKSGAYTLSTITDDGVRLWLNDELIIDNWTYHAPTEDNVEYEWKKSPAGKTWTFGTEENPVVAEVRYSPVPQNMVNKLLPANLPVEDIDISRILNGKIPGWIFNFKLKDSAVVYWRYYVFPLRQGTCVLTFQAGREDWDKQYIKMLKHVLNSVHFTLNQDADETEETMLDSVF